MKLQTKLSWLRFYGSRCTLGQEIDPQTSAKCFSI